MVECKVDILIIGGGLIGASLLIALKDSGLGVLLVESKSFSAEPKEFFDARSLALSPASKNILKMLGVWHSLNPNISPIESIHISEQRAFGQAFMQADNDEPLGYVVEMQHISETLANMLPCDKLLSPAEIVSLDKEKNTIIIRTNNGEKKIQAQLIIAADGTNSTVRKLCQLSVDKKLYNQQAVVANIGLARPHQQIAYERFTKTGPMAMLPMNGMRASMVWALPPKQAEELMTMDSASFLKKLQQEFGYRLGRFIKAGQRSSFPLQQMIMPTQVENMVVFVGNAAHTLHPVAGQGFNLGLRDVAMLAQCIVNQGVNAKMLKLYQKSRQHDQQSIINFTDNLVGLFTSNIPGIPTARRMGLLAFDNIPALKKLLSRYARGFAGATPDLACDIPLKKEKLT